METLVFPFILKLGRNVLSIVSYASGPLQKDLFLGLLPEIYSTFIKWEIEIHWSAFWESKSNEPLQYLIHIILRVSAQQELPWVDGELYDLILVKEPIKGAKLETQLDYWNFL